MREFLRDASGREVEVTGLTDAKVKKIADSMVLREYYERLGLRQIRHNLRTPILRRNR